METELKDLIEKIKHEGVEEAEKKADTIKKKAEEQAKKTIEQAEKEKKEKISEAGKEADRRKANGEAALRQAARDVLLGLREDIIGLFDKVIKKEVDKALSPDIVREMMLKAAGAISEGEQVELEAILSEKEKQQIESTMKEKFRETVKQGITLKASARLQRGFRIGEKDGNFYYDFSDEAISEAFRSLLNPKLAELLNPEHSKNGSTGK